MGGGGDGDESNSMKEPFEAFISGRDPWGNILTTCILPHSTFCEGIGSGVTFKSFQRCFKAFLCMIRAHKITSFWVNIRFGELVNKFRT